MILIAREDGLKERRCGFQVLLLIRCGDSIGGCLREGVLGLVQSRMGRQEWRERSQNTKEREQF